MNGKIIKEMRIDAGLTQEELAQKLGTTQRNISKYERGDLDISTEMIVSLCDFFGISADYLLGRSDDFGNVTVQSSAPALSAEEKELLALFRQMPHNAKVKAKAYCEGLVDAPASSNKLA